MSMNAGRERFERLMNQLQKADAIRIEEDG
jgi:hypothetical protein